jgi:lipopolysaccharide export system protein LptA
MTFPAKRRASRFLTVVLAICVSAVSVSGDVLAQGLRGLRGGEEPIEIVADEGIEWRREEKLYLAYGNARATRDEVTIYADRLEARYRETEESSTDIYRIYAKGNVRIVHRQETAYGDYGFYDVDEAVAILLGENLRLVSDEGTLTSEDTLEYWDQKQLAVARGNAIAVREDKRVRADTLTATLEENAEGQLEFTRIDGYGNVEMSTAEEYARADRGVYYIKDEFAQFWDNVRLTRDENQLNGAYAEIDLVTGVNRLLAAAPDEPPSNQVKGLILPESLEDEKEIGEETLRDDTPVTEE